MLTLEEIRTIGLPIENIDEKICLYVNASLDWLSQNTTLDFDKDDVDSVKNLPSGAKLFIVSFLETMQQNPAITSESIAGMSQNFSIRLKGDLLSELATAFLSEYYSCVKTIPNIDKWNREWKVET